MRMLPLFIAFCSNSLVIIVLLKFVIFLIINPSTSRHDLLVNSPLSIYTLQSKRWWELTNESVTGSCSDMTYFWQLSCRKMEIGVRKCACIYLSMTLLKVSLVYFWVFIKHLFFPFEFINVSNGSTS